MWLRLVRIFSTVVQAVGNALKLAILFLLVLIAGLIFIVVLYASTGAVFAWLMVGRSQRADGMEMGRLS